MSVWLSVGLSNIFQVPKDFAVYGRQFRKLVHLFFILMPKKLCN